MSFDPYEHITNIIVEYFEKNQGQQNGWKSPFACPNLPRNAVTGRFYNGINILLLWARMREENWTFPLFLTFDQARKLSGCVVKKGSKATQVCLWKIVQKKHDEDSSEEFESSYPILRIYYVFNVEQIEAEDRSELLKHFNFELKTHEERNGEIEKFLSSIGSDIRVGGNRAYYDWKHDYIQMPTEGLFREIEDLYATRFHEEAHRTGHKSRLNRGIENSFGTSEYAFEELVAEIAAAFLCADFNFEATLQHPEYVRVWCKRMRGNKYEIFRASTKAKQAVSFLKGSEENGNNGE